MAVCMQEDIGFQQHKSVKKSFMLLFVSSYHYSQWGGAEGMSLKIFIGKKLVSQKLYRTPIRDHSYFNIGGETFCCETTFIGFSGP